MPAKVHQAIYLDVRLVQAQHAGIGHQVVERHGVHGVARIDVECGVQRRAIEDDGTSLVNRKVLAYHLLQAELINALVNIIIAEHLHISLVVKLCTDIAAAPPADVVAGRRVHDNAHSGFGSGINSQVQADIGIALLRGCTLPVAFVTGKRQRVAHGTARSLVHKMYKLVACRRSHLVFDVRKNGIAVGRHPHVDVHSVTLIAGYGGTTRGIHRPIKRVIGRLLGVHHQHVVYIEVEIVLQVLEMLVTQIPAHPPFMALRVKYTVVAESQPVRRDKDTVPDIISGIEHIHFHGSISHHIPLHGKCLEPAVEMHLPLDTPTEI